MDLCPVANIFTKTAELPQGFALRALTLHPKGASQPPWFSFSCQCLLRGTVAVPDDQAPSQGRQAYPSKK